MTRCVEKNKAGKRKWETCRAVLRTAALSPHQNVHGAVHGQLAGPDDSALEPTQEGLEIS